MEHTATVLLGEVVEGAAFSTAELARACGVDPEWVLERVDAGVLQVAAEGDEWRFDSVCLTRARRVVHLESAFDADPQLAALTADLIEEVARLRRRVLALGGGLD